MVADFINFDSLIEIVEITTNSAGSTFWCLGSTQSHQLTQVGSTPEVQSSESQVMWPMRQKEIDNSLINSSGGYNSRTRSEIAWPPHANVSLNLFPDSMDDNSKTGTPQTVLTGYASSVQSGQSKGLMHDQVEKGKKSETSTGCRLFGFNLTERTSAFALPDKEQASTTVDYNGVRWSIPAASHIDQNPETSKEQKQVASETSTKEMQAKQGAATSMRTRTKVNFGVSFGLYLDCFHYFSS